MSTRSSRRVAASASSSASPSLPAQSGSATHPSHPQPAHDSYQYSQQGHGGDANVKRADAVEQNGFVRHVRASSDPISRGGAFSLDGSGGHRLDQEPNPFEQSFSGPEPTGSTAVRVTHGGQTPSLSGVASRRARSISPNSLANRQTPGGTNKMAQLSMIPTPGTDLSQFGWPQGSFTPGMLGGAPFDPAMMRTGLTPLGGLTSAGGGVSFPPPSPATAALFAMMTNNTPGTADGGGGSRPHEGPNEANNFEASFARAADIKNEGAPPAPEYAALHRAGAPPNARVAPGVMHPSHLQNQIQPPQGGFYGPPPYGHTQGSYGNFSQNAVVSQPPPGPLHLGQAGFPAQGNQNPLYLLSQASSHNDDAVVAAAALSGLATPGFHGHITPLERIAQEKAAAAAAQNQTAVDGGVMPSSMGTHTTTASGSNGQSDSPAASTNGGGSQSGAAPANGKGKRATGAGVNKRKKVDAEEPKKATPAKKAKRSPAKPPSTIGDDDGDDDDELDQDDGESNASPKAGGPPETEDEKRKNFLERNRQAALKCRQRKKAWLSNLQNKVESLTTDNDTLQATVTNLKEEIQSLRAILQAHANCPVASGPDRRAAMQNYAPNGQQRY